MSCFVFKEDFAGSTTLSAWKKMGGCGMTHIGRFEVGRALGLPEAHWPSDLTLKKISEIHPGEGRGLARFARDHLGLVDATEPYAVQS